MPEELTVSEFNQRVNSLVMYSDSIRNIFIVGEISGLKPPNYAGHMYFRMKDSDSVVNCSLFRNAVSRLDFQLAEGMKVVAFGSASYYAKGGSFGFIIDTMKPYGKGELQKKLEELTAKLLKEGVFDAERKREPPRYPRTIGVVTSATGAVIEDIIKTTARRFPVDILLAPAVVQGDDAPSSIVNGIKQLNEVGVDVIIVGRGGGSKEDLSAFNDENVVRAIYESKVPVISAVGHATDKSLTDMAADKYAETPTAAAMIATPDMEDERRYAENLMARAGRSLEGTLERMKSRFDNAYSRLSPNSAITMIGSLRNRQNDLSGRMDSVMNDMLFRYAGRLQKTALRLDPEKAKEMLNQKLMHFDRLSESMDKTISASIEAERNRLLTISALLDGINPLKVMERGYSIVTDGDGNIVTSISKISKGMAVTIKMKDGEAEGEIKGVKK